MVNPAKWRFMVLYERYVAGFDVVLVIRETSL